MVTEIFREIAIQNSKKQPRMVDQFLEDSPILEMIPFDTTSDGLFNVYEELVDVQGAGLVDLDEALPVVNVESKLEQITLSVMGGEMIVGEDKARQLGGPQAYFARKQPAILRKTGMDLEKSILYNNIRAKAIESGGEHLIDAGGSAGNNYSILAIKWVSGETTGLYDPAGFGNGLLFDIQALNGGQLSKYATQTADGRNVTLNGYAVRMKSYVGMQLANSRYVSAIVNIDPATNNLPTAAQIDDLIESVRGQSGGSTWLYMHPKVANALNVYKTESLRYDISDDIQRTYKSWNDIPIISSYNFNRGSEANV